GDDGDTGTASEYDIRYSTSTITDDNWDDATQVAEEPTPQPAGASESFAVTGLSAETTYYFAIKTADEAPNWSELSNVATGTTLDITPPADITNLAASNPTDNSITLTWTAPGDDGDTGTASEYDIRYSTDTITASSWDSATQVMDEPAPQPAGTSESFTVTGLSAKTTYYFAIKTADEAPNWSALSNVATIETLLADVTSLSRVETSKIRFSRRKKKFYLKTTWENIGTESFLQPLQVVIENITPPTVTVANASGTTADGKPYYDYSHLVGGGKLEPGETSAAKWFIFNSPDGRVKFEVDLSCWAKIENVSASPKIKSLIGQTKQIHIVIPAVSTLAQNFPNPFNPETWIPYELAEESEVRISIYDVQGKLVRTLYLGHKEIGRYFSKDKAAYWDGRNDLGEKAGSGIYFYQIQAGDFQTVRKMAIIK
ncbi:MAG: fibronectin type III domain-containing protein, partial [Candidatus Poribacteria bacterium]